MGTRVRTRRRYFILATALIERAAAAPSADARAAPARRLTLDAFLGPGQVLTVSAGGVLVDPYFSGKALLSADKLGMDVADPARSLLGWLLPRQSGDGRFGRYCHTPGGWQQCQAADADDSMCAIVVELIALLAVREPLRPEWMPAVRRCLALLDRLRTPLRTYSLSVEQPVQLLMDNCEVYRALARWADALAHLERPAESAAVRQLALELAEGMLRQFWRPRARHWAISSQESSERRFYPEAVAQLFPRMCGLESLPTIPRTDIDRWLADHGAKWLDGTADHYPWGLMALVMRLADRRDVVRQWLRQARTVRGSARWNVLEESIFQALSATGT